jgi:hypothetical protein
MRRVPPAGAAAVTFSHDIPPNPGVKTSAAAGYRLASIIGITRRTWPHRRAGGLGLLKTRGVADKKLTEHFISTSFHFRSHTPRISPCETETTERRIFSAAPTIYRSITGIP